jgi:carbon-monoxide dehydrogenase large subunit
MTENIPRTEDYRFLTGRGRFTEDISLPGEAFAWVLRSPHAHAAIEAIEVAEARAAPGVLTVLTGADYESDGLGSLPCIFPFENRDGTALARPPHPALVRARARHVGDPVALVVAETLEAARDAAESIEVNYVTLPAVTDTAAAGEAGAPQVWDEIPGNIVIDWEAGDAAATEAAFATASHVSRLQVVVPRVAAATMEARAAIGVYDEDLGRYTLHSPSQGPHMLRNVLCDHVLQIPREHLRVLTPDTGGGFGMKMFPYPEHVLVLWAARRLGRPVKWLSDRSEAFIGDSQARDHVTRAELALDADGRFLALRVKVIANLGAYLSGFAPNSPTVGVAKLLNNTYLLPTGHLAVTGVVTNTVTVEAYRGAGKPEALYVVERLVEQAARELGLDPVELRRRNLVPASAMPHATIWGQTFDACDFESNLDAVLKLSEWSGFAARRAEAAGRGRLRGIALGCQIHAAAGMPGDMAALRIEVDGTVSVRAGAQSTGQGHETTLAQLVAERLGLPFESVRVAEGDSDALDQGGGSGGSGTLLTSGMALVEAAEEAVEKGRRLAAHLLEAAIEDIVYTQGRFAIAGTDRGLGMFEAARAAARDDLPENLPRHIEGAGRTAAARPTYPAGCQVCEVEVDPETGAVRIVRFAEVDDYGRVLNPAIVAGQVHGAICQGIGPALLEACRYDADSGQPLTGSFMDYAMPRAADLPALQIAFNEIRTATNSLGVKGVGELATNGAAPVVINAVLDALKPLGVEHIEMPATPERVWRAIAEARGGG